MCVADLWAWLLWMWLSLDKLSVGVACLGVVVDVGVVSLTLNVGVAYCGHGFL